MKRSCALHCCWLGLPRCSALWAVLWNAFAAPFLIHHIERFVMCSLIELCMLLFSPFIIPMAWRYMCCSHWRFCIFTWHLTGRKSPLLRISGFCMVSPHGWGFRYLYAARAADGWRYCRCRLFCAVLRFG